MIDIVAAVKREEFVKLFKEFVREYASTNKGHKHAEMLLSARDRGRQGFQEVTALAAKGQDVTDEVLLKLLPHANTEHNRNKGAWLSIAPAVTRDIKQWFENGGWAKPEDWPRTSAAILKLAQDCNQEPGKLREACDVFCATIPIKGLQAGMLSPILNALHPDQFLIFNNKTRKVLNYFAERTFTTQLAEYPDAIECQNALISAVKETIDEANMPQLTSGDIFDTFCHWMVAVKKFEGREIHYWKVAPGEQAKFWQKWQDGNYISIGWDELGDISTMDKKAFDDRLKVVLAENPDWGEGGLKQVWTFVQEIREGDRIIANKGTSKVVGIGTVMGSYYFVPGVGHGHRIPVQWDDTEERGVKQPGWRKTVVELEKDKFVEITLSPPVSRESEPVPDEVAKGPQFVKFFGVVLESLQELGGSGRASEVTDLVVRKLHIPHEELNQRTKNGAPRVPNQIAWARFYLMKDGYIEASSKQGVWSLTKKGLKATLTHEDAVALFRTIQAGLKQTTDDSEIEQDDALNAEYSLEQCAEETGFALNELTTWIHAIERKGQAVLYGPPGTGKTFVAERLARHLIAGTDGLKDLVQFHPAYGYEDFIQGIRPRVGLNNLLEYEMEPGRFFEFCMKASTRQGRCVLIVDEINRANLARVFGELMYLLEYRDQAIPLAGGGQFFIPKNVRILGTMNTADRSIALVDHALRRRFAFLKVLPNLEILSSFHAATTGVNIDGLKETLRKVNAQIADFHYWVGISFFLRHDLAESIQHIWVMEIEPYLEEFFFDQPDVVDTFRWSQVAKEILQ